MIIFVGQMDNLKIQGQKITLVDQVEERVIDYIKENGFRPGDSLPSEVELAESLGVARSVLREALSRFKMMGMVESRTKRGMVMTEPSILGGMKRVVNPLWLTDESLMEILELRVALEIGITGSIFRNLRPEHIPELEKIVEVGIAMEGNQYAPVSEYDFHTKLYEISGNKSIMEFQALVHPVMEFVKEKYRDCFGPISDRLSKEGKAVSHEDLLQFIKAGDEEGYFEAIRRHFQPYTEYLSER